VSAVTGRSILLGALLIALAANVAAADDGARPDDAHRFRLVVTLPRPQWIAGEPNVTMFCLSSVAEEEMDVCLGRFQGHDLAGGGLFTRSFTLPPKEEPRCACRNPVVLLRESPRCWPMSLLAPDPLMTDATLSGFVTIVEDVREVGSSAETCVEVSSEPISVRFVLDHENSQPPRSTGESTNVSSRR
jgi:hypothetical protein